jgi:hypothetical protein
VAAGAQAARTRTSSVSRVKNLNLVDMPFIFLFS